MNVTSGSMLPPPNPLALLPNPFTPMAFLPPDIAVQVTISTYVAIAITAIQIWDTLGHLIDDYRLVRRNKMHLAMAVYFISRVATLTYMLGFTVMNTAPIGNCGQFTNKIIDWFFPISVSCSELLLLLHVRAVYMDTKLVVYFFYAMWISAVGSSSTPVIAAFTVAPYLNIGPTKYCIGTMIPKYVGASAIIPLVNDTLLFLALAWRLQQSAYVENQEDRDFKAVVTGKHLTRLSRALFQNGQAYFLSTVAINITTVSLLYVNSIPAAYRVIMGFPCIVIMNIMASRIYRNVNSGVFQIRQRVNGPSAITDSRLNVRRVDEINLSRTETGSGISGGTTAFNELKKESGSLDFVGENKV